MSDCASCGSLGDRIHADLQRGEELPAAAAALEPLAGGRLRRCAACGALFAYAYDYEYGAMGDGWEDASLERLGADAAVALLLAEPPSVALGEALAGLGVAGGLDRVVARVREALDAGLAAGERAHYEPVRQLFGLFDEQADEAALDTLFRHPDGRVRGDALYLAAHGASSRWFRAARAQTDPNAEVRAAAWSAAAGGPPAPGEGVSRAFLCGLADPDPSVRRHAAWGLAVLLEGGRSPGGADWAGALRSRVDDPDPEVRPLVRRALAAAEGA